jgi:hypothetical protein
MVNRWGAGKDLINGTSTGSIVIIKHHLRLAFATSQILLCVTCFWASVVSVLVVERRQKLTEEIIANVQSASTTTTNNNISSYAQIFPRRTCIRISQKPNFVLDLARSIHALTFSFFSRRSQLYKRILTS